MDNLCSLEGSVKKEKKSLAFEVDLPNLCSGERVLA